MAQVNFSECVRKIKSVSFALNELEVKGSKNLDILLGSIQTLDRTAFDLESGLKELNSVEPEIEIANEKDN